MQEICLRISKYKRLRCDGMAGGVFSMIVILIQSFMIMLRF